MIPQRLSPARIALVVGIALAGCSTDDALRPEVEVGDRTSAVLQPVEPVRVQSPAKVAVDPLAPVETYLAGYPRVDSPVRPAVEPAPAVEPVEPAPAIMPADEVACRKELQRLDVAYTDLDPIHGGGSCGIDHPVRVTAIGNIQMKPAATLRCEMAATFARWTKKELVPAARARYFSGVKTIHQGSSYSCRRIRGTSKASEHSRGNALDIMRIELKNGRDIDVRKPGWFAFRTKGFLNTVRADGCEYFTTVLGPGYDADHKDHFHFDIMARRNGYRACR